MSRVLILAILLTGCASRRTLGTAVYPRFCWDQRYIEQRDSGQFAHTFCVDKGEMFIDGKRAERRWNGAAIQWEPVR